MDAQKIGGKKYAVDSYKLVKAIILRKFTQLSSVKEKTVIGYIKELVNKYPSGAQISNSPFNPKALRNKRLRRRQILEVPVQTKPVPVPEKKYYIC